MRCGSSSRYACFLTFTAMLSIIRAWIHVTRSFPVRARISSVNHFRSCSGVVACSPMIDRDGIHVKQIPDSLLEYLRGSLTTALIERSENGNIDNESVRRRAKQIFERLYSNPRFSQSSKVLADTGLTLCKALVLASDEMVDRLCNGQIDLDSMIADYQNRLESSRVVFETISQHHRTVAKQEWTTVASEMNALQKYSFAATSMGNRPWVVEGNVWMENFAISYFRHGGARRHYLDTQHDLANARFSSRQEKVAFIDRYSKDLMQREPVLISGNNDQALPSSRASKIRLLDVGSCYNPIAKSVQAGLFDVTALDLYPSDPTVFQADFLNLPVGEAGTTPITVPDAPETGRMQLKQLPAASFDVVTMSLVLSYLASPDQRIAMIRKARQLLISPDPQSSEPHRTGLLLIVEKESIFTKDHTPETVGKNKSFYLSGWKDAIAAEGFELVKYRPLRTGGHLSHAFAFATTPTGVGMGKKERSSNNEAKMWIRQDFIPNYPDHDQDHEPGGHDATVHTPQKSPPEHHAASLMKRRIGIVGGGIGGSALALSLQLKEIPYVIFEKDAGFDVRKQGYALTMQQGGPALRALGLGDLLGQHGALSTRHTSFRWDGSRLGAYGLTKRQSCADLLAERPADAPAAESIAGLLKAKTRHNVHIPRQRLREIMMQSINTSCIFWNKKLASFEVVRERLALQGDQEQAQSAGTVDVGEVFVRATFEDGTVHELSALVGADGIFSTVRQRIAAMSQQFSTPAEQTLPSVVVPAGGNSDLRYLGLMVILGITPNERLSTAGGDGQGLREQRQWLDGETRIFSMPYDKHHTMWQLSYPCAEADALALTHSLPATKIDESNIVNPLLQEALRRCEGWAPELVELLRGSEAHLVSGHPVYDRDPDALNPLAGCDKNAGNGHDAQVAGNGVVGAEGLAMPETVLVPRDWPVTVLGDAAHPMSPFKGQGANQAILDALSLSRAISTSNLCGAQPVIPGGVSGQGRPRNRPSLSASLRQYEAEMFAKGAEKVQRSRDAAYYLHSDAALTEGNVTRAKAAEDFATGASLTKSD